MALKNKTSFPPLGFIFYQAETGWSSTAHIGFDPTVQEIITHRKANPRFNLATDYATVSAELDSYTEARLRSQYGAGANEWIAGPPATASPVFPYPPLRPRVGAGGAAEGKLKIGVGLIRDFLGPTLRAVSHALAEKRASVCVTCSANKKGGLVAHLGGEGLKLMLQARSDLKLETSHDGKLFDCEICTCSLQLKPHVPLDYILEKTPPDVMAKFPSHCWILNRDK